MTDETDAPEFTWSGADVTSDDQGAVRLTPRGWWGAFVLSPDQAKTLSAQLEIELLAARAKAGRLQPLP